MTTPDITPVESYGDVWAKREDAAGFTGPDAPSGAKVRQYVRMIADAPDDAVLMVGCSADSAMQVYVAHAAATHNRPGTIVVPRRAKRTAATRWAAERAEVVEVSPGYPTVYRKRMRDIAAERGRPVVRWDRRLAAEDTAAQVANLPADVQRVVVPSGSGLTAAGVMGGLMAHGRGDVVVVAVTVSGLASYSDIVRDATAWFTGPTPGLEVVPPSSAYGRPVDAHLPDGTRLDPFYAAKAWPHVRPGDAFWVVGRRPDGLQ